MTQPALIAVGNWGPRQHPKQDQNAHIYYLFHGHGYLGKVCDLGHGQHNYYAHHGING